MKFVNNFLDSTIRTLTTLHEVVSNPTSEVECYRTCIANALRYIPVLVKLIYVRFHFYLLHQAEVGTTSRSAGRRKPLLGETEGDNGRRNFWVIVNGVVSFVCYVRP